MRRAIGAFGVLATLSLVAADTRADDVWTPPPAEKVRGYSPRRLPCEIVREDRRVRVRCDNGLLEKKSMHELSIARNTIYARYGWDGFRKPWLKTHFHAQPWFKANPKFTDKLLTHADKENAHLIAMREESLSDFELRRMRDAVGARYGKIFDERPEWRLAGGRTVESCTRPEEAQNIVEPDEIDFYSACYYAKQRWYKPNPKFDESMISGNDKIELGLIARAMGEFALDGEPQGTSKGSLDRLLTIRELRELSLRDLRLLRYTIYARKGKQFQSSILHSHFTVMAWYTQNPDYTDKLLSANDVRNLQLIKSVEKELGGPLGDDDDDDDDLSERAFDQP
jgi:hypothetical protein